MRHASLRTWFSLSRMSVFVCLFCDSGPHPAVLGGSPIPVPRVHSWQTPGTHGVLGIQPT